MKQREAYVRRSLLTLWLALPIPPAAVSGAEAKKSEFHPDAARVKQPSRSGSRLTARLRFGNAAPVRWSAAGGSLPYALLSLKGTWKVSCLIG